jgi:hypothetical protein
VVRFWNHQVHQELDSVLQAIWFALQERCSPNLTALSIECFAAPSGRTFKARQIAIKMEASVYEMARKKFQMAGSGLSFPIFG